jgi:poly(A) polymerase
MVSPRPDEGLRLAVELGLAEHSLPELLRLHLPQPARHHMKDVLDHTLDAVRLAPPDKVARYAALLHDIAKPETFSEDASGVHFYRHEQIGAAQARDLLTRLRQPAPLIQQVEKLVRYHLRVPSYNSEWSDAAVRRLMYELGEQIEQAIAIAEADVRASDPSDVPEFEARLGELRSRIQQIGEAAEIAKMRPLLNGDEVMALLGLTAGPKVGEVLDFLLDEQLDGRITTREEAVEAVRGRFG